MNKKQLIVIWATIPLFLPILILLLITPITFAQEDLSSQMDKMAFIQLQISAVTTEIYKYLGWSPDEKEWLKEASEKATADLDEIRQQVTELKLPKQLTKLKKTNLEVIDKLKEIYVGIEKKRVEGIKKGFVAVEKLNLQYSKKFKDALKKYRPMQKMPKDFKPVNEEIRFISDEKDKGAYLKAVELLESRKEGVGDEAYELLKPLKNKYKDTAAEDCIMLRISDCLLVEDSAGAPDEYGNPTEAGLSMLSGILDKKRYSPVLYEAFYKWRTIEQMYNHGMSNMSEIPNKEYNEKRWEIIQTIKQHLKDNSDDSWVKEQVELLLSLHNIMRGGAYGNWNLTDWGALYLDLQKTGMPQKNE